MRQRQSQRTPTVWYRRLRAASITAAVLLTAATAGAQGPFPTEEDNLGRGFDLDVDKTFLQGEFDQVNLFNGNLTLTIPIGGSYPLGPEMSYGLTLVYNSNLWDSREKVCLPSGECGCCTNDPATCTNRARQVWPQLDSNAGLGWKLSLGDLYEPSADLENTELKINNHFRWVYLSPDGGRHAFYEQLHHEVATADASILYSNDGSYLRLLQPDAQTRVVQFPDGTEHSFEKDPFSDQRWRITRMDDRYGNNLTVAYSATDANGNWTWTLDDSHGRSHVVHFETDDSGQQPADVTDRRGRVTSVDLAAFDGARAVYGFVYDPFLLKRGCGDKHINTPEGVGVPFLQRIDLPQGLGLSFAFTYDRRTPTDVIACPGTQPGAVTAMTLPTGGSVAWTYGVRGFPASQPCDPNATSPLNPAGCTEPPPMPFTQGTGVATRTLRDESGTVVGTWSYDSRLSDPIAVQCRFNNRELSINTFATTTVTNPLGETSEHYFSVFQQKDQRTAGDGLGDVFTADGWSSQEYGLPFRRDELLDGENVFLSSRTFRASRPGTPNECTVNPSSCLVRSTWVRYEQDPPPPGNSDCSTGGDTCSDTNPRQVKQLTGFETASGDSGTRIVSTSSGFDGFGNFRSSTTVGKVGFLRGVLEKTLFRDYNPGQRYTPGSPQMSLPDAGGDWLWTLAEREVVTHGSGAAAEKSESRFCFDDNGFLTHARVLADPPGLSGSDLLTVRVARKVGGVPDGRVAEERLFGGDLQDVPTGGGFCGSATGLTAQSITTHQYTAGVRRKSTVLDGARTALLNRLDSDVDVSTGLPLRQRDAAGVVTELGYDVLGRLISRRTGTQARTVIEYVPFKDGVGPARVAVERQDAAGQPLTFGLLTFDGLGRLVREESDYPGDLPGSLRRAVRTAGYDALGRLRTLSEWGQGAAGPDRVFSRDFDGRVTRVSRPDGSDLTFAYTGARKISRTVRVNGAAPCPDGAAAGTCVTTSAELDPFGRVVRLSEPSGPGGALVHTDYAYDEGDRLTAVDVNAGGTGAVQERRFVYDPRGLLTCESHPELGATTGGACAGGGLAGTVRYTGYDALGNATRVDRAGVSLLRNVFDAAGRPVQVWDQDRNLADGDDDSLLLTELFYARANQSFPGGKTDRRRGKVVYAKRHHALPEAPRTIGERFVFLDDRAGNVSEAQLRSSFGRRFFTTYVYDLLGNVDSIAYPVCADSGCAPASGDPVGVDLVWEEDRLTAVGQLDANGQPVSLADRLVVHPSGLPAEVRHANSVTDVYGPDPSGMARYGSITLGSLWNLDSLGYDGAGNVTSSGGHVYTYDAVSRLLTDDVGASRRQTATYDRFGNLTSLTTDGDSNPVAANTETNRLTLPSTVEYDGLGRVTDGFFTLGTIGWDPLDRPIEQSNPPRQFLYDAGGNRVAVLQPAQGTTERIEFWTVRGADGKVLRDFLRLPGGSVQRQRDYYHRGSQLLATAFGDGSLRHYHLDHLGSTRLITDATGVETARFEFHPFGQQALATGPDASGERFRFTGHERDTNCNGCAVPENDDLDYMLARHYSPVVGRFLSMDEVLGEPGQPQSWNRYSYVLGNPLTLIDPLGKQELPSAQQELTDPFAEIGEDASRIMEGFLDSPFVRAQKALHIAQVMVVVGVVVPPVVEVPNLVFRATIPGYDEALIEKNVEIMGPASHPVTSIVRGLLPLTTMVETELGRLALEVLTDSHEEPENDGNADAESTRTTPADARCDPLRQDGCAQ